MDPGSSAPDLAHVLERLARVETHVAMQQATISAQQATIAEQQEIIAQPRATIAAQQEALTVAHEQITLLKRALFGPKRERHLAAPDQRLLFETTPLEPASATPAPVLHPPKGPRPRRRKFVFPEFLPVVRHEHQLSDTECACGNCGAARTRIHTLVTRQIEIERAKAYIEKHVRYTYACAQCRDGSQMQTTAKPPTPLEKSPFGASVWAWLISA